MRHIWTIVCQLTSEDKITNAFSLIGALEGIEFSADPTIADVDDFVIPLNYHIVSTWWRDETESSGESEVKLRLFSPGGEDLGGPDLKITFSESQSSRYNVNIQGFPYKGDGVYQYIVFHIQEDKDVEVQRIPIKVERIPFQESQT